LSDHALLILTAVLVGVVIALLVFRR